MIQVTLYLWTVLNANCQTLLFAIYFEVKFCISPPILQPDLECASVGSCCNRILSKCNIPLRSFELEVWRTKDFQWKCFWLLCRTACKMLRSSMKSSIDRCCIKWAFFRTGCCNAVHVWSTLETLYICQKVNSKKLCSRSYPIDRIVDSTIEWRWLNESFENDVLVKYFVSALTDKNIMHEETERRSDLGNVCSASVQNLFVFPFASEKHKHENMYFRVQDILPYYCR